MLCVVMSVLCFVNLVPMVCWNFTHGTCWPVHLLDSDWLSDLWWWFHLALSLPNSVKQ